MSHSCRTAAALQLLCEAGLLHHSNKLLKADVGVVGAGGCLGVVLDGHGHQVLVHHACSGGAGVRGEGEAGEGGEGRGGRGWMQGVGFGCTVLQGSGVVCRVLSGSGQVQVGSGVKCCRAKALF